MTLCFVTSVIYNAIKQPNMNRNCKDSILVCESDGLLVFVLLSEHKVD
jgi:hypothetical protein